MLRVGLTGGIACGKSAVARELERLGVPVIDADLLARRVVEPGEAGLAEVVARFGEGVLDAKGRLDRAALGQAVFGDEEARGDLEAITHPRIARAAAEEMARLAEAGHALSVYEAALIVEVGLARAFDVLLVVAARPELQVRRIMVRDGLDEARALARIAAQMPTDEKAALADIVIWNEGDLQALGERVVEVKAELDLRSSLGHG